MCAPVARCGRGFSFPLLTGIAGDIMIMIMKCRCAKCGYDWKARAAVPKECPACKSRNWNRRKVNHGKQ